MTHVLEGLVRSCVHFTPTNRPDFETITIALQSLRETEQGETSGLQSFTPLTNESNDTSFIGNGGGQAKQVGQIAASENNDSSYINSSLFRANKQPPTKNSKSNRNPRTSNARQTNVIAFSKRTCCIFGIFVVLICVIVVTIVFVVGRSTSGANTSTSNSGSTSASTPTSSTQTSSLQTPIVILPSTQQFVQATVWFDGGGGKGKDSATTSIAMYSGIAVFGFQNGTTVQVDVSTGSIIKTFPKVSLSPISSLSIDKNDGHVCMIYSDGTALIADIFSSNVSFTQNVTNSQFRDSDCRFPFLYTQYQGNGYCKFNLFESNSSAATTSSATLGPFFPAKVVAVGRGANRDYIGLANGQIWEIQLWYDGVASLIYSLPSPVQFLSLRGRELYVYTTSQIVWSIHFYDWKVRWQVDVSLISSGVVDMKATDMSVFLLTQTSLFSLDSSGNTLSQIPVTFADGFIPMQMEISSGFAYIIGSSSNVVRVNLMMVVSQASNNATITPFMKSSKPTPWFQNSWENIPSYLINTDGLFVIGYSDGNAEVISPLATSVEETMLWAGESPQNPVNLAINTMFIDPEHGYACIDHSGGVVNAFDEQLWGWWVGSVTSTTTSSKAGIYCMWPWVIWSRGMTMYVTDFYSSPSPVIINTFGFQSSIVSFAAGLNGWLYVGLDDGSVHQYITLNNTATALINRSSSQAAGISFVRVWGDKVFALYSNMTLTRISISAHRVEWSVNLSSILAQALSSSSSTTIVEMCVQDTVLLILTSSAKMYQFDVNNPLTVQNIIYSLLPIQQATAMTISQGYVFVGVPQDTTAMGVFTFALTGI